MIPGIVDWRILSRIMIKSQSRSMSVSFNSARYPRKFRVKWDIFMSAYYLYFVEDIQDCFYEHDKEAVCSLFVVFFFHSSLSNR
jgi:hypothetical protein